MFEPTCNFSSWLNGMLGGRPDLRNLYWFTYGIVIANSELTSVIHTPSINIASTGDGESKLFAHFDISNNWHICLYSNFCIRFSSAWDTTRTWAQLFITILEHHFWGILEDGFLNVFSWVFRVFGNILVVSASTPLIYRPVTQDASRVDKTTCNLSNSNTSNLSSLASIEKLD